MRKARPIRMCIICKKRLDKYELHSFKIINNELKFDLNIGRSLYLCSDCLNKNHNDFIKFLQKNIKSNINKEELGNKLKERFLNGE